jgi:hypothetical protein
MWLSRITDQDTSTPAAVKSTSHQKTVKAAFDRVKKLRNMKGTKNMTQR